MRQSSLINSGKKRVSSILPSELDSGRLPDHIAIIMDGNGRWAKGRGLPRSIGHKQGVEALKKTLRLCDDWGISALTVYAFSTENWSRPGEEVSFLLTLFEHVLQKELESLIEEQVKINFLGDIGVLPDKLKELMKKAIDSTQGNKGIRFNVCTNYGGRRELVFAAKKLALKAVNGELDPNLIDEEIFSNELFTAKETDPDLLIRTSGENRLSNFLLWQLAYSEIHITNVLWPDFDANALKKALLDYQSRLRRFGGV